MLLVIHPLPIVVFAVEPNELTFAFALVVLEPPSEHSITSKLVALLLLIILKLPFEMTVLGKQHPLPMADPFPFSNFTHPNIEAILAPDYCHILVLHRQSKRFIQARVTLNEFGYLFFLRNLRHFTTFQRNLGKTFEPCNELVASLFLQSLFPPELVKYCFLEPLFLHTITEAGRFHIEI